LDDVLKLPATIDVARARAMFEDLCKRRGSRLVLDASALEKAGALAIEVLIAGQRQWEADGHDLEVVGLTSAAAESWTGLGLTPPGPVGTRVAEEVGTRVAEEGGAG
jgi:chemotaxis protein CheX